MFENILVIIPCRAGSQRFPGKNTALFQGVPLVVNTINIAREAELNNILVSTDDKEVMDLCDANNVRYTSRPAELCGPDAKSEDVVAHAAEYARHDLSLKFDSICLMQVTSPLLQAGALATAMNQYLELDLPSLVAVTLSYQPCGAFYIVKTELFRANPSWYQPKGGIFILPWEQCLDVDYQYTLDICQAIASGRTFGTQI